MAWHTIKEKYNREFISGTKDHYYSSELNSAEALLEYNLPRHSKSHSTGKPILAYSMAMGTNRNKHLRPCRKCFKKRLGLLL